MKRQITYEYHSTLSVNYAGHLHKGIFLRESAECCHAGRLHVDRLLCDGGVVKKIVGIRVASILR